MHIIIIGKSMYSLLMISLVETDDDDDALVSLDNTRSSNVFIE